MAESIIKSIIKKKSRKKPASEGRKMSPLYVPGDARSRRLFRVSWALDGMTKTKVKARAESARVKAVFIRVQLVVVFACLIIRFQQIYSLYNPPKEDMTSPFFLYTSSRQISPAEISDGRQKQKT